MDGEQSRYKKIFLEFLRFATVGTGGALIDFGLFNILSWLTGITSGNGIIPINMVSFGLALIFSFMFNKRWTFKDLSIGDHNKKFTLFLLVSLTGLLINTVAVRIISTNITPGIEIHPQIWANIAKILATGASGLWNFFGYKNIVFKK